MYIRVRIRDLYLAGGAVAAAGSTALLVWAFPPSGPGGWWTTASGAAIVPTASATPRPSSADPVPQPAVEAPVYQAAQLPIPTALPTPALSPTQLGPQLSAPVPRPVTDLTTPWHLVGLGDSVLTHCHCPGVLRQYADLVGEGTGRPVRVNNAAESGATSADLLEALQKPHLRSALAEADAVVVFVGANDFSDAFDAVSDGASPDRFAKTAERLRKNLTRTLARIHELVGARTPVLVCGYWNDFKDGRVARHEYTAAQRRAAAAATDATNDAIQQSATTAGAAYVSTAAVFSDHADRTALLDPDGDHLSAVGAQLIATALLQAPEQGRS